MKDVFLSVSASYGYTGSGTVCANEMNLQMKHAPDAGLI